MSADKKRDPRWLVLSIITLVAFVGIFIVCLIGPCGGMLTTISVSDGAQQDVMAQPAMMGGGSAACGMSGCGNGSCDGQGGCGMASCAGNCEDGCGMDGGCGMGGESGCAMGSGGSACEGGSCDSSSCGGACGGSCGTQDSAQAVGLAETAEADEGSSCCGSGTSAGAEGIVLGVRDGSIDLNAQVADGSAMLSETPMKCNWAYLASALVALFGIIAALGMLRLPGVHGRRFAGLLAIASAVIACLPPLVLVGVCASGMSCTQMRVPLVVLALVAVVCGVLAWPWCKPAQPKPKRSL